MFAVDCLTLCSEIAAELAVVHPLSLLKKKYKIVWFNVLQFMYIVYFNNTVREVLESSIYH